MSNPCTKNSVQAGDLQQKVFISLQGVVHILAVCSVEIEFELILN